jgi:ribosomal protein L10
MPVSKRSKKVSLTKVKKRNPPQARATYVDTLRSAVEQAPALYLIGIDEFARPTRFKQLRAALPQGSTLLLGKKTLMKVALGDSEENELKDNMRLFAEKIEGGDALLATAADRSAIEEALAAAAAPEFATAGFVAPATVTLERGPLDVARFPTSMLAALKKLDMPVEVRDSALVLIDDWRCATKGDCLTAAQAKMLFHLDMRVGEFKPEIRAAYVDGIVS